MAKFTKGQGGRPKGAKNLKTREKESRTDVAAQVTAAVLAAAPIVDSKLAKRAANKAANKTANLDAANDAKSALEELQRRRWNEGEELAQEAARLKVALDALRAARAALAAEEVPTDLSSDAEVASWKKAQAGKVAAADEAIKTAKDGLADTLSRSRACHNEAGQWAKDRIPYDYAKLQPQSGNTDKVVNVTIVNF